MNARGAAAGVLLLLAAGAGLSCSAPDEAGSRTPHAAGAATGADAAFARLAALDGEWVLADAPAGDGGGAVAGTAGGATGGAAGARDVAVIYRTTGAGTAVIETLWPGQADEMITVYHRDGDDLVLTHYCSVGNQPRMRAGAASDRRVDFVFDGGTGIDPARDMHMHALSCEFVSPDEILVTWTGWSDGRPVTEHAATFRFVRKPA